MLSCGIRLRTDTASSFSSARDKRSRNPLGYRPRNEYNPAIGGGVYNTRAILRETALAFGRAVQPKEQSRLEVLLGLKISRLTGKADAAMKTQHYQLRISGLREIKGQIRASALSRILHALLATAERTTRLLATGTGGGRGARPRWLDATIDFTITGLTSGSTVVAIEAPRLGETAREQFAQADLWSNQPSLDETALDLVARSIHETQMEDPPGDYFDSSVLDAILKFRTASGIPGVRYKMIPQGAAHGKFELDDATCASARARLEKIPAPQSFVVSGRLDEIRHGNGRFRLLVDGKSALLGRLDAASLDVEDLRYLWGKQTTVEGIVHFKANGQPRFIEARRIGSRLEGDRVFEGMPSAEIQKTQELFPVEQKRFAAFDPIDLAGSWPGDEPIDELLAQLD